MCENICRERQPLKIAPFWWICKQPASLESDDDGGDYDYDNDDGDDDDDGIDEASGDSNGVENCTLFTDLQTQAQPLQDHFSVLVCTTTNNLWVKYSVSTTHAFLKSNRPIRANRGGPTVWAIFWRNMGLAD